MLILCNFKRNNTTYAMNDTQMPSAYPWFRSFVNNLSFFVTPDRPSEEFET